uniref:FRG1-like family protein n=1 Tax=Syphacia muris TaxID=451379 RepID=A0A0N5AJ42_9BILA
MSSKNDYKISRGGGWWRIAEETDLKGGMNVALECGSGLGSYLAAMDNGRFTVGIPHPAGEEPNPEEVLTLIKTPDDPNISLKTGFGKYVGVDAEGRLVATADAIGTRERLFVVFENGKSAVQALSSNLFLSLKPDNDGYISAVSKKVNEDEITNIRTNAVPEGPVDWRSEEDKKSAAQCETAYIKMYQHSKVSLKGKNITVNLDDKTAVKRAQQDGNLHEFLLERRTKTKSDKYC